MNSRASNDRLTQAINMYKALLKDKTEESQVEKILEGKKQELLEMLQVVATEKVSDIKEGTDEASKIKEIAKIKGILELYAYIHKGDITRFKK